MNSLLTKLLKPREDPDQTIIFVLRNHERSSCCCCRSGDGTQGLTHTRPSSATEPGAHFLTLGNSLRWQPLMPPPTVQSSSAAGSLSCTCGPRLAHSLPHSSSHLPDGSWRRADLRALSDCNPILPLQTGEAPCPLLHRAFMPVLVHGKAPCHPRSNPRVATCSHFTDEKTDTQQRCEEAESGHSCPCAVRHCVLGAPSQQCSHYSSCPHPRLSRL